MSDGITEKLELLTTPGNDRRFHFQAAYITIHDPITDIWTPVESVFIGFKTDETIQATQLQATRLAEKYSALFEFAIDAIRERMYPTYNSKLRVRHEWPVTTCLGSGRQVGKLGTTTATSPTSLTTRPTLPDELKLSILDYLLREMWLVYPGAYGGYYFAAAPAKLLSVDRWFRIEASKLFFEMAVERESLLPACMRVRFLKSLLMDQRIEKEIVESLVGDADFAVVVGYLQCWDAFDRKEEVRCLCVQGSMGLEDFPLF